MGPIAIGEPLSARVPMAVREPLVARSRIIKYRIIIDTELLKIQNYYIRISINIMMLGGPLARMGLSSSEGALY